MRRAGTEDIYNNNNYDCLVWWNKNNVVQKYYSHKNKASIRKSSEMIATEKCLLHTMHYREWD